ncbi:MAG: penicillin-binding protein 2 [Bacteroidales bacterium]|nr:penicillin-binding protein 2 [Bacteroidales bacterium]
MKDIYSSRKIFFYAIVIIAALILLSKLFALQVLDKSYRISAQNNVLRYVTQYPARGLIYDRKGKLLVYNQAAYDLMVIPGQTQEIDTLELCTILDVDKRFFSERMKTAIEYSEYAPSVFLKMVSSETYARLQEVLYKYPGFYVQARTLRKYSYPSAAHALGYVGEVNNEEIKSDPYYRAGDYIGKNGIEKSYELQLRGRKGLKIFLVDVYNRVKGLYQGGRYDTIPVPGKNLITTLDIELQRYGEVLMGDRNGSIVALEPSTGEVLALISTPDYDPSLLVGRIRSENYTRLQNDTLEPLFNRALMASYPPGSTFKPVNGLIALQEGIVTRNYEYFCDNGYYAPGIHVACHHFASFNMPEAITASCNAYFCNAFRLLIDHPQYGSSAEGLNRWRAYLSEFGFGSKLGIDFPNELAGFVPKPTFYDNIYGENRWKALTIISMGIGQGELGTTPLQMANMTAIIANRGYYLTPHIVKAIDDDTLAVDQSFRQRHELGVDSSHFGIIVEGMKGVVNGGENATARWVAIKDIVMCGKTGTAENPHGPDHSIFVAFAPEKDPKIAIAVYVENTGFGSTYAAPVASLMIEKYLKGNIENKWLENYILKPPPPQPDEELEEMKEEESKKEEIDETD